MSNTIKGTPSLIVIYTVWQYGFYVWWIFISERKHIYHDQEIGKLFFDIFKKETKNKEDRQNNNVHTHKNHWPYLDLLHCQTDNGVFFKNASV